MCVLLVPYIGYFVVCNAFFIKPSLPYLTLYPFTRSPQGCKMIPCGSHKEAGKAVGLAMKNRQTGSHDLNSRCVFLTRQLLHSLALLYYTMSIN